MKFNCPLTNKPIAEGKKRKKGGVGGGGRERERERKGERRREGEESAIKQFSGTTKPRRGLDYCK